MKKIVTKIVLTVLIPAAIFTACSNMMDNQPSPANTFLTVSPSDNTKNVSQNQTLVLQFAAPVNPAIVEKNFSLISSKDINDTLCPQSRMMGHSDMQQAMGNMSMMNHIKDIHATKGTFKWNSDNTRCEFTPDTKLEPDMDYMMFVDNDMMSHMKDVMSNSLVPGMKMGVMNCDCNKGDSSPNMMMHFYTGNK